MPVTKDYKSCLRTQKLIMNNKQISFLHLAELFSVHSLRMHKDHNAVHYKGHTALRNWRLCLRPFSQNSLLPLVKKREVTLYFRYSLHHTITVYCTAVLVESLIFLLSNQQRWRSDVKCLAKQGCAAWLSMMAYEMEWQWMGVK